MFFFSIIRYVVILYPFRARMQIKTCAVLVAVINLLSMAFTAPYVHIMDSVEVSPGITSCTVCSFTIYQIILPFRNLIMRWSYSRDINYKYCISNMNG